MPPAAAVPKPKPAYKIFTPAVAADRDADAGEDAEGPDHVVGRQGEGAELLVQRDQVHQAGLARARPVE